MLRQVLPDVKTAAERELSALVLGCRECQRYVRWVSGLGIELNHWAHREPAPHVEPVV